MAYSFEKNPKTNPDYVSPVIGKQEMKIEGGLFTPEVMWAMGIVDGYSISPDHKHIAYVVTYFSVAENTGHNTIHIMDIDGKNEKLLTTTSNDEDSPRWIKNGTKIAFLSNEGGQNQLWEMNPDGTDRKKLSFLSTNIGGFSFSPDEKYVLFTSYVPYSYRPAEYFEGLDRTTGLLANDLMYKHWNTWQEVVPHPFYAPFDGEKLGEAVDILAGTLYESPLLPFGGMEQLCWSNDSKKIAYTCKKKIGTAYTLSTDSDIYVYDIETRKDVNICKLPDDPDQNLGYDINPRYSPSGKYIAWLSMEHDGYESDKNRLYVMDLSTNKKTDLTKKFDADVSEFCWNSDTDDIYYTAVWHGRTMIYHIDLDANIRLVTDGDYDYFFLRMCGRKIMSLRHSLVEPNDLFIIDPDNANGIKQLTHENDHLMNQIELGKFEERWTDTKDGKQLQSWVMYPPDFDPNKKYPAIIMCMGGPQEACSQVWSNKWNFALIAYQGYVMIMPNRRGCPGFGRSWEAEVSGDYGGLCMDDYFSAIDDLATEPYIDKDKLGCVGASFGAYSVYWLAGHHEKRFKAFMAHDGVFNIAQQYLSTDEMWFANWDNGGSYWDKNPEAQATYANSPHYFVDKWDTPILCVHSLLDFRIPIAQGQAAFAGARVRNIDAELLCFSDEGHLINKPQNSVLWHRTFFRWMAKYLKN